MVVVWQIVESFDQFWLCSRSTRMRGETATPSFRDSKDSECFTAVQCDVPGIPDKQRMTRSRRSLCRPLSGWSLMTWFKRSTWRRSFSFFKFRTSSSTSLRRALNHSEDGSINYKTLGMWFTVSLFVQFRVLKIPLFSEKIGKFSRIFQEKYCTFWIF